MLILLLAAFARFAKVAGGRYAGQEIIILFSGLVFLLNFAFGIGHMFSSERVERPTGIEPVLAALKAAA